MSRKKLPEPEYRLNIFYRYDEQSKKKALVFLVRTVQEFVNFNYEILLSDKLEDSMITVKIAGLNTPTSLMPGTGPAQGKKEYTNLAGMYTLRIQKLDGTSNEFKIEILQDKIRILESPKNPIVVVSTQPLMLT